MKSMPHRSVPFATKIAFGMTCSAVIGLNLLILRTEQRTDAEISEMAGLVYGRSSQSALSLDTTTALTTLMSNVVKAESQLAGLESARPESSLVGVEDRLRRSIEIATALAAALAEASRSTVGVGSDEYAAPNILYANYDLIDEVFELRNPPNTARNPATYTFAARYGNGLFPEVSFHEITKGQTAGDYKLLHVNVETRLGEVVKDKIVRYRRRKGGVREPVWSYKRLPGRQVVVLQLSHLQNGTAHIIHYPGIVSGESRVARQQIPVAWIEVGSDEKETRSRFPVMAGSEFSWENKTYLVTEVSPQQLTLVTSEPPTEHVWLLGGGP
jgi:hypothetical protein